MLGPTYLSLEHTLKRKALSKEMEDVNEITPRYTTTRYTYVPPISESKDISNKPRRFKRDSKDEVEKPIAMQNKGIKHGPMLYEWNDWNAWNQRYWSDHYYHPDFWNLYEPYNHRYDDWVNIERYWKNGSPRIPFPASLNHARWTTASPSSISDSAVAAVLRTQNGLPRLGNRNQLLRNTVASARQKDERNGFNPRWSSNNFKVQPR